MALNTQPYKGARDFYPEDKRAQKYMFGKLRAAAERFGYEEYDAPILEPEDIYLAKSGAEIVNEQTYSFEDRGGRKVVIRPEMTPTVSRMVAARRQELGYPLRWYSIPNLWRYERPQKGRLREHWQLNVDIFGVKDFYAEIEIITMVDDIFRSFGASQDMYEIKLNNRQLTTYILEDYLKLSSEQAYGVSKLIDRMKKMERTVFINKLEALLDADAKERGVSESLLSILDTTSTKDLPEEIQEQTCCVDVSVTLNELQKSYGIENVSFDPTLMRGFDYYTGIVFEAFDTNPENNRAMMGGGRYDGLVGLFGVDPVPTVGFGWGDVTLQNFLESHELMPGLKPETDLYVALVGDVSYDVQPLLKQLREQGNNVAADFSRRKLGDQFKTAEKKGIERVLIVGESEIESGQFKLKNLTTGQEEIVKIEQLAK